VLVACSGGADSLALLSAAVFEARATGHRVVGVVVDHRLQAASAQVAARTVAIMRGLGVEARSVTVEVGGDGGPEGAARRARYAALEREADAVGAEAVLVGHTRDDQAETVLLGLARGSGLRSLSGMAAINGRFHRPLLALTRAETREACLAQGLEVWEDPHNTDERFARVRVRRSVLPVLERELGPGVADALARTARLARQDADALDVLAAEAWSSAAAPDGDLSVAVLTGLLPALRSRVLRAAALAAGCPATELTAGHVDALDALIRAWRGQREVHLPGHVVARRTGGTLTLAVTPVAG
jgi:tRNA(Ile)-lysidine synthase